MDQFEPRFWGREEMRASRNRPSRDCQWSRDDVGTNKTESPRRYTPRTLRSSIRENRKKGIWIVPFEKVERVSFGSSKRVGHTYSRWDWKT